MPHLPHWGQLRIDPETVLEHLWESSLVALTLVTEDGFWLHPSPALCELLEYTADELERMTYMDVTHPLDLNSDVEMAKAVQRGDVPYYVMSKRYITKTGKVIWIKLHVSGFFDAAGKFLLYLSQIAPAEVWDPKAPVIARSAPWETRALQFFQRHWWKILPLAGAATAGAYELVDTWIQLTKNLPR